MKKTLAVICLMIVVLLCSTAHSFTEEKIEFSFFVGEFELNEINWNNTMESMLLKGLSNTPDNIIVKVIGRTDKSGTDEVNIPLAKKRADLIAEKTKKIKPDAFVESEGLIYNPKEGQNIDYKMVEVIISYKKKALTDNSKKSLHIINTSLRDLQNSQNMIVENISKFNNSQSIKALELALFQFNQNLSEQNKALNIALSENQSATENRIENIHATFKDFLLLQNEHLFEKLQEESRQSIVESSRINDSMRKMLDSIGKVEKIQISDAQLSQEESTILKKELEENDKAMLVIKNEIEKWKNETKSMQIYILWGLAILGLVLLVEIFAIFNKKKN